MHSSGAAPSKATARGGTWAAQQLMHNAVTETAAAVQGSTGKK